MADDETKDLKQEIKRLKARVAELEDRVEQLQDITDEQREWMEDYHEIVAKWHEWLVQPADEPGMVQSRLGEVIDQYNSLAGEYNRLLGKHRRLMREWNQYFEPPAPGRPIEASDDQQAEVRKLRKAGRSLRGIALDTGLSFRTVRTIVAHLEGKSVKAKGDRLHRERLLAKLRQADARARKRAKDSGFKAMGRLRDSGEKLKRPQE